LKELAMRSLFLLAALSFSIVGCTTTTEREGLPPVDTVDRVDLKEYLGTWYEVASFPQRFQAGCSNTQARYALRDDGDIDVFNSCTKDGEAKSAQGRARVVEPSTNAKLEVSFFGPFWGDYWIIDLADDYSHAVVGSPSRDALWILSRSPSLDEERLARIVDDVKAQGFDVTRLERTAQATR
jgi:apolipoprotein D and lipocalin family protein